MRISLSGYHFNSYLEIICFPAKNFRLGIQVGGGRFVQHVHGSYFNSQYHQKKDRKKEERKEGKKENKLQLGMAAHTCNLSMWQMEAEGQKFKASLMRSCLSQKNKTELYIYLSAQCSKNYYNRNLWQCSSSIPPVARQDSSGGRGTPTHLNAFDPKLVLEQRLKQWLTSARPILRSIPWAGTNPSYYQWCYVMLAVRSLAWWLTERLYPAAD